MLSPILYLFLAPWGKLHQKLQQLLSQDEKAASGPPPIITHRRPGPRNPAYGIRSFLNSIQGLVCLGLWRCYLRRLLCAEATRLRISSRGSGRCPTEDASGALRALRFSQAFRLLWAVPPQAAQPTANEKEFSGLLHYLVLNRIMADYSKVFNSIRIQAFMIGYIIYQGGRNLIFPGGN